MGSIWATGCMSPSLGFQQARGQWTQAPAEATWFFSLHQDTEERRQEGSLLLLQLRPVLSGVLLLGTEDSDPPTAGSAQPPESWHTAVFDLTIT